MIRGHHPVVAGSDHIVSSGVFGQAFGNQIFKPVAHKESKSVIPVGGKTHPGKYKVHVVGYVFERISQRPVKVKNYGVKIHLLNFSIIFFCKGKNDFVYLPQSIHTI